MRARTVGKGGAKFPQVKTFEHVHGEEVPYEGRQQRLGGVLE